MVHDEAKYDFRKLRLDTGSVSHGAGPSAFASLSPPPGAPPVQHSSSIAHVSSELSFDDLLGTIADGEDSSHREISRSGELPALDRHALAERRNVSSLDIRPSSKRDRGTSVSFSSHATLDDGMRHSVDEPLPRAGSGRRRNRGISMASNNGQGDGTELPSVRGESPRINPFTGELVRRRTKRSDMTSRLDRIPSAQDEQVPPLTSGSAASPFTEAIGTPISTSMTASVLLSPANMASPGLSPTLSSDPWPMSGRDSIKSRILSRHSSFRNSSRRSSRVSGSSPASAFLSQWGKESLASIAPDPDEEGQTVGLNNEYVIGRQIGYGGSSVVKELHGMTEDGKRIRRTVKIVRKAIPNVSDSENDKQQQSIEHEVDIWRYLHHEHILPLHAVYDTEFATFCVMDLVEGGTLFELVRKTRNAESKGLKPALVKHYSFQLASALRYLHEDIRIVHRDVKLENCLLDLSGKDAETKGGQLKLCDFGLAEFISGDIFDSIESLDLNEPDEKSAVGVVGTLQYAAPESFTSRKQILQPSVDIWAFGVCVYAMITGELPFRHSLQPKVIEMITSGSWNSAAVRNALTSIPKPESEHVMDLLNGCLEIDPDLRWTISDVMASSWFDDLRVTSGDDWRIFSRH